MNWLIKLIAKLFQKWFGPDWPYQKDYKSGDGNQQPLFGCTVHWADIKRTKEKLNRAKNLGCVVVRTDCIAGMWDGTKDYLKDFVNKSVGRGMRVMFVMGMSSLLDEHRDDMKKFPAADSPEFIEAYIKWLHEFDCFFIAYRDKITLQILNEPNCRIFYDLEPEKYMEILKASYAYLKSRGWKEVVMCGLVGNDKSTGVLTEYLGEMLDEGLRDYTDALCFHWYMGNDKDYSWVPMENIRMARDKGFDKFIYITEFGHNGTDVDRINAFKHFFKVFGKEYGVNLMLWYCMQNDTKFQLCNKDMSVTLHYNYIKENLI